MGIKEVVDVFTIAKRFCYVGNLLFTYFFTLKQKPEVNYFS